MNALLPALLAVAVSLIALLSVPVELHFRLQRDQAVRARVLVRWMFGLIRFQLKGRRAREARKRAAKPSERKPSVPGGPLSLIRDHRLLARAVRLLREAVVAIQFRRLRLRLRLGFDDPADTGMLWSVLGSAAALAPAIPRASVDIAPDFDRARFALEAGGEVRAIPARVAWIALTFLLSPPFLRAAWRHGVRP
jgi:hypothetical protein